MEQSPILLAFAFLALLIWLNVRVLHKAGFSGGWVLTQVIPIVNIIFIWVFAFAVWPNGQRDDASDR